MITDSVKFSKKLLNSGFTHQQIEVLQDVINDNLEYLVTKKNLDYVVTDLKRDTKSSDEDIHRKLESKIWDVDFNLQSKIISVKFKLEICILAAAFIAWIVFLSFILSLILRHSS